ncbi:MAG: T9SS type A sorting domain-containing protein [Chitinophagaceae bacterium]|nr:T9SS type A sorting domain-containing protein [Chitinophagaceae bacterium]
MKTIYTPKKSTLLICLLLTTVLHAQQITINQRSHIVMNGNVSLVINNAAFKNNGNFTAGTGTVAFSGNNDTATSYVDGSNNTVFYNLTISKNAGAIALKSDADIKNILSVSSGTLYTDSNLTLKSDAAITARVAPVAGSISGKVKVERYIPARRAWRMLTAPVTSSATIFNTWQNSGIYQAGINTFVTGPNPTGDNGLDASPQNNISMKTWNAATQQFSNVTNTKVAISSGTNGSADNTGYYIFVRGDRNSNNFNTTTCNATTLSSTGKLQTGTQTFPVSAVSGAYTMIGNPYASPVDFSSLTRNNLVNRFYVWDPSLNILGGYVMLDDLSNTGTYTKSVSASSMTKEIQSGQAFLVQSKNAGAASLVFNEASKSTYNNTQMFRPVSGGVPQSIRVNLNIVNDDSTLTVADGIFAEFSNSFSSGLDQDDALKFTNINENIAFLRNGTTMAAERRATVESNDTLFIKLWKTAQKNYELEIVPTDFYAVNIVLQDLYLNQNLRINLLGATKLSFAVDANPASADVNRFRIIFKKYNVLPVTVTAVKASLQNNKIAVEWKVENELNIVKYEVEKSVNGSDFSTAGVVEVLYGSNAYNTYNWLDVTPAQGTNFYRIKIYDRNGDTKYTTIVKTKTTNNTSGTISIYPNPVKESIINVLLNNQPKGQYHLKLISISGQLMYTGSLVSETGNGILVVNIPARLTPGTYQLEVITPEGKRDTQKVIAE